MKKNKEDALTQYVTMVKLSWTYAKLTKEEQNDLLERFAWAQELDILKGTYDARWKILDAMYGSFLAALGYYHNPSNWRN